MGYNDNTNNKKDKIQNVIKYETLIKMVYENKNIPFIARHSGMGEG